MPQTFNPLSGNFDTIVKDHTKLTNKGTNTHAQIDTHIADTSNPHTTSDVNLSTSDVTDNNVSTSKHGFAPKAPNDATKFLDGTGVYSVPSGGGAGSDTTAIHDNTASEISAITEKTAPVGADIVIIEDSANSNNKKKVQFTNFLNFGIDGGAFNDTFVSTVPVNGGAFV